MFPAAGPSSNGEFRWAGLYKTGGAASIAVVVFILAGVAAFVLSPPPSEGTAADWFALFQRSRLLGLLDLDLAMLASYLALIPVVLALYAGLRRAGESLMALGATVSLIAITAYFASSRVFEMLVLSRQFAAATTEAQKTALLAAGQSMLTTYLGNGVNIQGTAFNVSYVLWSVGGIMISAVMRRSGAFGRAAGWIGIVGNAAALGLFLPTVGIFLSLVSLVVQLLWYVLVARGLFRLARRAEKAAAEPARA